MCEEEKEIEVEYLPTIGGAESIKTRNQGRIGTAKGDETPIDFIARSAKKEDGKYGNRCKIKNKNAANACCGRILRFPKSSEAQKNCARRFLDGHEDLYYLIFKIDGTLRRIFYYEY